MYSLRVTCTAVEVDRISAELWEAGTAGIRETEQNGHIVLIASFETNGRVPALFARLGQHSPKWQQENDTDWVSETIRAWPSREIGERIFLAPLWDSQRTPAGRVRVVHNPGLACGTGEHPCSQLALAALEKHVRNGDRVADVGTGSGILAIAALRLGAASAVGIDVDEAALAAAKQNFDLNQLTPALVVGSADCLPDTYADITIANINATVLVSILDDLMRITRAGGCLILTGFPEWEADYFKGFLAATDISNHQEWRCVTVRI